MIPLDRIGTIKSFKNVGFAHTDKEEIAKQLLITKEKYFKNREVIK